MILLLISFVAGVLTVLAPCTLPLLPVIIGSSIDGSQNKRKALVITLSLGVSVIAFTLLLKVSTLFIHVPQAFWTLFSGGIIILFGLVSIFPDLWDRLPFVNRLAINSNKALSEGYKKQSIWGDIIIGASLGPVFSTCSPTYFVILATVLPQSLFLGLTDLLVYTIGLCVSLLLIAFLGQKISSRLEGFSDTRGFFRKTLGVIFVILGIVVIFGVDKQIEASLLNHGLFDITRVEQQLLQLNDKKLSQSDTISVATSTEQKADSKNSEVFPKQHGPVAPEIIRPSGFINTNGQPITITQFHGKKVILLDIWTYSCINCQRTLPYVESWYKKYKDLGLEVIGLHTPEFAFEKAQRNVEDAVKRLGIAYPVVMDNDYATWNAYGNQYWPRKYLISEDGEIIYDHIGEGNYDETEKAIQAALSELNGRKITGDTTPMPASPIQAGSPETYFGSARNEYLGNGTALASGKQTFVFPSAENQNTLYLSGDWNMQPEYAETGNGITKIDYTYQAKGVYFVAGSLSPIDVEVTVDGKPVDSSIKGADVFYKNGSSFVTVNENRLYKIIEDKTANTHKIEFIIPTAGLQAFTFTFG